MTFKTSDLSVLAYANNFTLWHYTTIDSSVTTAGYFNNATDMVRIGDLMIANIDTDGTPATKLYIVTGNSGGTVAVTVYS
ncbi:MAG: hypothetical protein H6863_02930 [Rhodospirillales bacterium]|nr:hypothetical protein [Rhodospirillales bacterium]